MDAKYCSGCKDDFYNGKNDLGVGKCWLRDDAKREKRMLIPIDMPPPYKHIRAELLPTCYKRQGYATVKPEAIASDGYWKR